jgi:hypothetical protein
MTTEAGARLSHLSLTIMVELSDNASDHYPEDFVIEARDNATVQDLVHELASYLRTEPRASFALFYSYRGLQASPSGADAIAGYLPLDVPLSACGLVDGTLLRLRDRDISPAPQLAIDTGRGDADLFLVDERGTRRGRVTRLPLDVPVEVGSAPQGNWCVVVDDDRVGKIVTKARPIF